ncbi:MAG: hypothetical protein AAF449_02275, partial [Myxococcota bacterium]
MRVSGQATDDSGLASVFIKVGANVPQLVDTIDGYRTWTASVSLPRGEITVAAFAFDTDGRRSDAVAVRIVRASPPDQTPPTVTISTPEDGDRPRAALTLVQGRASDDVEVVRMEVERNGVRIEERPVQTDDFFRTWVRQVSLLPGQENVLVFRAFDALGRSGEAVLRLIGPPQVDGRPPELTITEPGAIIDAEAVLVRGTAVDSLGVREVKIRVGVEREGQLRFGREWFARSSNGFSTFEAEVLVPSGPFILEVKAIDVSGLATVIRREVLNQRKAEWSQARRIPLFLRDGQPVSDIVLDLNRAGVNEVIDPSIQRDLKLLDLDSRPLLQGVLDQIKGACGNDWRRDDPDPNHDCDLTALGRTFGASSGGWRLSPEYSLVRLLTLTPANVVVEGTSIAGLQGLADFLRLGGGFRQILADTLGIARTDEIVSTQNLAEALRTGLVAPHPATGPDGSLPITLYDAMNDLTPLRETFGPVGGHPGVLDPASRPRGVVFTPDFRLLLTATSNLRWLDGVDMGRGKEYISVVVDTTGPTRNDVLEFDFVDPARFAIEGLAASPTVDLRISVDENPAFVASCSGSNQCQSNLPTTPLPGFIWQTPTWEVEHVITRGA